MKLTNLKVNHLKNPLGFCVKNPSFSFQVEESTGRHLKSPESGYPGRRI